MDGEDGGGHGHHDDQEDEPREQAAVEPADFGALSQSESLRPRFLGLALFAGRTVEFGGEFGRVFLDGDAMIALSVVVSVVEFSRVGLLWGAGKNTFSFELIDRS